MRLYQKPSGIWAVDYVDPSGVRRRVSTGLRDKAQARARGKDIAAGKVEPEGSPAPASRPTASATTMDALWKRCELTIWHPREIKSLRTLASNLKILRSAEIVVRPDGSPDAGLSFRIASDPDKPLDEGQRVLFASLIVTEVRYSHLEALSQWLFGRGYSAGTVRRKMHMVGASLTMAAKWELIQARPPMPSLPEGGVREAIISDKLERAIFAAVEVRRETEPNRDWRRYGYLLRFLLDTAVRLGEALAATEHWIEEREVRDQDEVNRLLRDENLPWAEVKRRVPAETRMVLNIPASVTKSGKGRIIPLSDAIVNALPYLKAQAVKGRLFPYTPGTAQYYWRENLVRDLEVAGHDMTGIVLHTFRHTKLTRLAKLPNFGIQRVSKWAGHADIKITAKVYAKLDVDDLWAGA